MLDEYLSEQVPDYLADLEQLVNVDCGTHNKAGVDTVGRILHEMLVDRGWSVEVHPQTDYGDLLGARLHGSGTTRIMLLGHLDTVYADGTVAQRPLTYADDRAIGPGVADMKAGLLTGIYAVDALRAVGFQDFAELIFFINSEEEVGSPVSTPVFTELAQREDVDAALVLEAARSNGDVVSARKGWGRFNIEVTGREAHAGIEPEQGANAIVELAHHVLAITALNGMDPGTTVNVGVIEGGTRPNVVPASARAVVDVRVQRSSAVAPLQDAVNALPDNVAVPGASVQISGGIDKPPMEKTEAIAYLVDLAQQCARDLSFSLGDTSTGGTSDANPLAAAGVPVLDGLGPIGGGQHGPDEYLDVTSIAPRTALLASLIQAIAEHQPRLRKLSER